MATAQATISRGFRSMPLPAIAAFTAMGLFIILMGFFGASSGFKSGAVPMGLLVSGSLAAVAAAYRAGAAMIRVHDVRETVDFLKVLKAIAERER